ncbi:hypothetical protein GQ53DRAFT_743509 [Thozetella sp. PMI_491]|nr:hypothetical protein GQ53DRAFT_743509 [Thozetella sp. PMI_491]
MLFKTIALALTGLAVPIQALGFTIPDGQPDGVYIVTYLEDGIANHTKIADPFVKGIRRRAPGTQGLEIANDPPHHHLVRCGRRV